MAMSDKDMPALFQEDSLPLWPPPFDPCAHGSRGGHGTRGCLKGLGLLDLVHEIHVMINPVDVSDQIQS